MIPITGTMIAGILGLSRFETPQDVWMRAKGLLPTKTSEAMEIGLLIEPYARRYFETTMGVSVTVPDLVIHRENPRFQGHPDGVFGENNILEIKTTSLPLEECPVEWTCQVMWYMYLLGGREALIFATQMPNYPLEKIQRLVTKVPLQDFVLDEKFYHVSYDPLWMEKALERIYAFVELLDSNSPPEEWHLPTVAVPDVVEGELEADDTLLQLYNEARELHSQLDTIQKQYETIIEQLKSALGSKEYLRHQGRVLASWKVYHRTSLDRKILQEQFPDVWNRITSTKSYRVFTLK